MFEFLKTDFLNTSAHQPRAEHSTQFRSTLQSDGVAEALVQTVWKDLERLKRLPPGALLCEVLHRTGSNAQDNVQVQLTILQWSTPLALHMVALQNLLRTGLDRYEPGVDHSRFIITWRLADDCGCPYTMIPDTMVWTEAQAL